MLLLSLLLFVPMIMANKELRINDYRVKIDKHVLKSIKLGPHSSKELNLTGLKIETINDGVFDNLINLKKLDLSNNLLRQLPNSVFKNLTNLQYLSLSENGIRRFNDTFIGLDSLKTLYLWGSGVNDFDRGSLFGVPKSCNIHYYRGYLSRMRSDAFENPAVDESQQESKAKEENSSSLNQPDIIDYPPRNKQILRIKICIKNGTLNLVDFVKEREIVAAACKIIEVDDEIRSLSLNDMDIRKCRANWYRLGNLSIDTLDLSSNNFVQVTRHLINDLPASIKNILLKNMQIKHLKNGTMENKHIVSLDFSYNSINKIDNGTFQRTNIEFLNFDNNKMTNTKFAKNLPASLIQLHLYENEITEVSENSFEKLHRLTHLKLHGNLMTSLKSNAFHGLSSLQYLDLSSNHYLTNLQPGTFRHLKNLHTLNLSHGKIGNLENGVFEGFENLVELDLQFNRLEKITRGALRELPDTLSKLDLSGNGITSLDTGTFVNVPKHSLSLRRNSISHIAVECFNLTSLKELSLDSNALGNINDGALDSLTSLEHLNLKWNYIREFNKRILRDCVNLQTLNLEKNHIAKLEVGSFANVPKDSLNLEWNKISEIAPGSFDVPQLKHLNLDRNELRTFKNGTFAGLSGLETLKLRNNKIQGIEKGAMRDMRNLRSLDIAVNPIGRLENGALFGLPKSLGACWIELSGTHMSVIQGGVFDDV